MILLVAVLVALIISLLRGGRLAALANVPLRYGWLALLSLLIQGIELYFPLPRAGGFWSARTLLLVGSYLPLILVVALNRQLPGVLLVGWGLLLNLAVMVANGGYMPIAPEALAQAGLGHLALGPEAGARLMATKDVLLPREQTLLWVLSDIWAVPPPVSTAFSLGDVLLVAGIFTFFGRLMSPEGRASRVSESHSG